MSFDFSFSPAKRTSIDLRVLLCGESGQGKTFTALALARHLGFSAEKIAVIDSETHEMQDRSMRGSAEKYEGIRCECHRCRGHGILFGSFSQLKLPPDKRDPRDYVEAIRVAGRAGFEVLIVDSITHEWDSCKKLVDSFKRGGNTFAAWEKITPLHDDFVQALMDYPGHVIACVRGKEKMTQQGREIIRLGLLPQQRSGIEFEFDVWLNLHEQTAHVAKTRANRLRGRTFRDPGLELAEELLAWSRGPTAKAERADGESEARKVREAIEPNPRSRNDPHPEPRAPRPEPDPRPAVEIARPAVEEHGPIGPGYVLTVEDLRRIDDLAGTRGKLRVEVGKMLRESVMTQGIVAGLSGPNKKELARDPHMLAIALAITELRRERKELEESTHAAALIVIRDIDPGPAEVQIACREAGLTRRRAIENYSVDELAEIARRILATRKEAMYTIEQLDVEDLDQVVTTCEIERRPVEEMGEDLLVIVDEARRQGLVA